jgi:endonuclease/exonuclease/phosphatase family metal-dependent hydrolase
MRLRVATYNIHKGVVRDLFGLRRVSNIHELRTRVHQLEADLILLQEVQGEHKRHAGRFEHWPSEPQDQFLARSPSLRHSFETAYGPNATYLHGHHGNALLSRFPIIHRDNRDFSDHALEKRGVLHCVVDLTGQPVHCFVIHFGLLARSRERQLEALIDWIGRAVPLDVPLIIGGDFNDWRNQLSRRLCEALGVIEAFDARRREDGESALATRMLRERVAQGLGFDSETAAIARRVRSARTFPALVPWLRMDRIYLRGFQVEDAQVPRGAAWARLSDHSPVIADLRLAPVARVTPAVAADG